MTESERCQVEQCSNPFVVAFTESNGDEYRMCRVCFAKHALRPLELETPRSFRNILSDLLIHTSVFIAPSCPIETLSHPVEMAAFLKDMKKSRRYRLSETLITLALFIDPTQEETL